MLQNHRLKHLLAAGILTGLVLATLIAFTWRDATRADAAATQTNAPPEMSVSEGTDALRAENAQLRNAFATMQAREKEYHTQLEAANRTILQLQDTAANRHDDEHDEHEEHEHEHEQGKDKDD